MAKDSAPVEKSQVVFPEDKSELENEHGIEVVVHDYDADGNIIGWHKELKDNQ